MARRARRVLRWIGGIVAGLVGFVMLAVIGLVMFLETSFGQGFVRGQVQHKLATTFVGGAQVGHISGTPFTTIVVRDLVIDGPDHRPAVTIGTLRLHVRLLPLISHRLVVSSLVADDVDVIARRDANGQLELAHLTRPGPPSTWNVELGSVRIHRGHVAYEANGQAIDLDRIELGVSASLPHGGPIDAGVALSALWRQRRAPIGIAAVLHSDRAHVAVPLLAAAVEDVDVAATGLAIPKGGRGPIAGEVFVRAPAVTVAALAPGVHLPADVTLAVTAHPEGDRTALALAGTLGRGTVHGAVLADLAAKHVSGFLGGSGLELGALSRGKLEGTGNVFAALDAAPGAAGELPRARGIVQLWGEAAGAPETAAIVALDTAGDRASATLGAASTGGLVAAAGATVRRDGRATTLERAVLVAATRDPARATGGKAKVHGALDAHLEAHGTLAPEADLAIAGHVDGRRVRAAGMLVRAVRLRVDARHLPAHPIGTARLDLTDLEQKRVQLRRLTLAAGNRPDGKIQVTLRTEPKPAPWLVDLDALVTPGKTIDVVLQRHFVRAAGGATWRGRGGEISIGPQRIVVRDVRSASRTGKLALGATYVRAGRGAGDLAAKLSGAIDLADVSSQYRGRVTADVDVTRRAARWTGKVAARADGVRVSRDKALAFDARADVAARPGGVTAAIDATSTGIGAVKLALDVAAPANLANARGWRALRRDAIHQARIELDRVDLAKLAKAAGVPDLAGQIAGELHVTATGAGGVVHLTDVRGAPLREVGALSAELRLAQPAPDTLAATATARIASGGALSGRAEVQLPDRPFDPAAWHALGMGALRGANVQADAITFEPGTLAKVGIASQLRGRASVSAVLEPALRGAKLSLELDNLHGGVIAEPVTIHVDGASDATSTRGSVAVLSADHLLVEARAHVPLTLAQLRGNPAAVRGAPLDAHAALPEVPVRQLLAVIGNTEVTGGVASGTIDVGGTVGRPTVTARLGARDVSVPGGAGVTAQVMKQLTIAARWDGTAANVAVDGFESSGGRLHVTAGGPPSRLAEMTASLDASRLDLAPLVAFLPGPAGGVGGVLDAKLSLHGLDPKVAKLAGNLHITQGRIPIAPQIGTLFHGDVALAVVHDAIDVRAAGKLGNGDVQLSGSAPLSGAAPTGGQLKLTVRHIQLIGKTQPIIDAQVAAQLGRVADHWRAKIDIRQALVHIPQNKGHPLAPSGPPKDVIYTTRAPRVRPRPAAPGGPVAPPHHPALVAEIALHDVRVESKELRGNIAGNLRVAIGKKVHLVGNAQLVHADLELFSRRYQVDRAVAHFDGSTDPELDIRITHDFPDVTTITQITGRLSKPKLELASQPGIYSQSELLGFLLGGEPNGNPNDAPSARQRVEGAAGSLVANQIGNYVKKALPVDIDVLRYESSTATSSAAVTVGTWLSHDVFIAYRQHLEARPDENSGEGEVEYWFERRLVLQATIGDRGYDGADLMWRRHW